MSTENRRVFDRLKDDMAVQCQRPAFVRRFGRWATEEPALCGVDPAALLSRYLPEQCRVVNSRLAALLRLAAEDDRAAEFLLVALVRGLASTAVQLGRVWDVDRAEVDQLVVSTAWIVIRRLAGRSLDWPATTILGAVRNRVRYEFETEARRRSRADYRSVQVADPGPGPEDEASGASLLKDAVHNGLLSKEAADLIYATRVLGFSLKELAGSEVPEVTLRVQRWRAERAVRGAA